jgi:putative transposase
MTWYRRWRLKGGVYFFTLVTYQRRPILVTPTARPLLRASIRQTQAERPFQVLAMVLLPEHLHCLWALPSGDADFATRWRLIKSRFTMQLLAAGFAEPRSTNSRQNHGEHAIWQRRYVEHLVRDEDDWKQHLDYIHYNPTKHGHVTAPRLWPYSTFGRYVRLGEYSPDWGSEEPASLADWEGLE